MPPVSVDNPAALVASGFPLLVLRFEPATLEIGFATILPSNQAGMKTLLKPEPALQLHVEFPRIGETRTLTCCFRDGHEAEALLAFSLDVLAPFDFGGITYDPLGSMAASVARLADPAAGTSGNASGRSADRLGSSAGGFVMPGDGVGRPGRPNRPNDGLMALWAAIEADLYRFAKDPGFTAALDVAATDEPEEYRRFARLNDLYRDMVKLLLPCGTVPRRWTTWLRGQEYRPVLPASFAVRIEGFLVGRAGQPEEALYSMARLLVKHGALIMKPLT